MSQDEFAQAAGVHRNTQVRYETDKRQPDRAYVEALERIGVDVDYVLRGLPAAADLVTCPFLEGSLGDGAKPITLAECRRNAAGARITSNEQAALWHKACQRCHKNPIRTTPRPAPRTVALDLALLEGILVAVESATAAISASVSPSKKARVVTMLYRAFMDSGKIDAETVRQAVSLATD